MTKQEKRGLIVVGMLAVLAIVVSTGFTRSLTTHVDLWDGHPFLVESRWWGLQQKTMPLRMVERHHWQAQVDGKWVEVFDEYSDDGKSQGVSVATR